MIFAICSIAQQIVQRLLGPSEWKEKNEEYKYTAASISKLVQNCDD